MKPKRYDFSQSPPYVIFSLAKSEVIKHCHDCEKETTLRTILKIMAGSKQVDVTKHMDVFKSGVQRSVRDGLLIQKVYWYQVSLLFLFYT